MLRSLFLFLALVLSVTPSQAAGKRIALVLGNASYGSLGALANPVNDAKAMRQLLETQLGFEVIAVYDADHEAMRQAIAAFGWKAVGADYALFYYAGHGVELDGANYLLPVRAEVRSDVDLINHGYRLDQVIETMVMAGARNKIVIVDACRNNPLPAASVRGARSLGLKALYATKINTLIAFATEPGRVAFDGDSEHSPFTASLLDNLAKPGMEIQSVLRRVRNAVYEATRQQQFPWWDDMFLSEVYLGGEKAAAGGSRDLKMQLDADAAACELLGETPTTLMMEAYLRNHPKGSCAEVVRERLLLASRSSTAAGNLGQATGMAGDLSDGTQDQLTPGKIAHAYRISSYWNHNGSVVALSAQGRKRVFYYEKPRELIAKAGAGPGTLLFKGEMVGMTYTGQAFLFSKKCAPVAYPVQGTVSADFRRVVLTGDRPVRDAACMQIGTKLDRLVFEYKSKTL